jgi:hypothetical protein
MTSTSIIAPNHIFANCAIQSTMGIKGDGGLLVSSVADQLRCPRRFIMYR